jgi:hypothetical protein
MRRFLKKVAILLGLAGGFVHAGTSTTRLNLYKPSVHEIGWGEAVNQNFNVIDSSVGVLSGTNTWTGTNSFAGPLSISSPTFYRVWIATPSFTGSDRLAVLGPARSGGGTGGAWYACDSNWQNCTSVTSAGSSFQGNVTAKTGAFFVIENTAGDSQSYLGGGSTSGQSQLRINAQNGVYVDNGVFSASTATITSSATIRNLSVANLPSGECVQTAAGGRLTTTGAVCGGGGGGATPFLAVFDEGIKVSSPTQLMNFVGPNVTATLTGGATALITITDGSPLPLAGGATNYIQNISSLQAGATAYPDFLYVGSSSTIGNTSLSQTGLEVRGLGSAITADEFIRLVSNGSIGSFAEIPFYVGGSKRSGLRFSNSTDGFNPAVAAGMQYIDANGVPSVIVRTASNYGISLLSSSTLRFYDVRNHSSYTELASSPTITHQSSYFLMNSTNIVSVDGTVPVIKVLGPDSNGKMSMVLAADNNTGGSGSGGYNVEPATVTFNLAKGLSVSTISATAFNSSLTSVTVTGSGGLNSKFGVQSSTGVFSSTMTAQSIVLTGAGWPTLDAGDTNIGPFKIAGTTSTITVGHMLVASSTNGVFVDGGVPGTGGGSSTPGGSNRSIQYNSTGTLAGSGFWNMYDTSTTLTTSNMTGRSILFDYATSTMTVTSMTATNLSAGSLSMTASTVTSSGVYWDLSRSTMTLSKLAISTPSYSGNSTLFVNGQISGQIIQVGGSGMIGPPYINMNRDNDGFGMQIYHDGTFNGGMALRAVNGVSLASPIDNSPSGLNAKRILAGPSYYSFTTTTVGTLDNAESAFEYSVLVGTVTNNANSKLVVLSSSAYAYDMVVGTAPTGTGQYHLTVSTMGVSAFGGAVQFQSKTKAQIQAISSPRPVFGDSYACSDCVRDTICTSTGGVNSFVAISSRTQSCN